jgi:hypothetical protein
VNKKQTRKRLSLWDPKIRFENDLSLRETKTARFENDWSHESHNDEACQPYFCAFHDIDRLEEKKARAVSNELKIGLASSGR